MLVILLLWAVEQFSFADKQLLKMLCSYPPWQFPTTIQGKFICDLELQRPCRLDIPQIAQLHEAFFFRITYLTLSIQN